MAAVDSCISTTLSECDCLSAWLGVPVLENEGVGAFGQVVYLERVVGGAEAVGLWAVEVFMLVEGDGRAVDGEVNNDTAQFESAVDQEVVVGYVGGAVGITDAYRVGVAPVGVGFGQLVGVVFAVDVGDMADFGFRCVAFGGLVFLACREHCDEAQQCDDKECFFHGFGVLTFYI